MHSSSCNLDVFEKSYEEMVDDEKSFHKIRHVLAACFLYLRHPLYLSILRMVFVSPSVTRRPRVSCTLQFAPSGGAQRENWIASRARGICAGGRVGTDVGGRRGTPHARGASHFCLCQTYGYIIHWGCCVLSLTSIVEPIIRCLVLNGRGASITSNIPRRLRNERPTLLTNTFFSWFYAPVRDQGDAAQRPCQCFARFKQSHRGPPNLFGLRSTIEEKQPRLHD
jgi:hypothetical protein